MLIALTLFAALSQQAAPAVLQRTFVAPEAGRILSGMSSPRGYTSSESRPLVLAHHPGGNP